MSAHTENGLFASDLFSVQFSLCFPLFLYLFLSFSHTLSCFAFSFTMSCYLLAFFHTYITQSDRTGDSFHFFNDQNCVIASTNNIFLNGRITFEKDVMHVLCVRVPHIHFYGISKEKTKRYKFKSRYIF